MPKGKATTNQVETESPDNNEVIIDKEDTLEADNGTINIDEATQDATNSESTPESSELAVFEEKLKEQEEKYLRLQADFDNFRKRSQKEKLTTISRANKELILSILPIIDNLERAIVACNDPENAFAKGVDMVHKQLLDELSKQGVKPIDALHQPFDPNFHQAVAKEASDFDSDMVIMEFQKGYLLHEEVLRPTMVKVSE